MRYLLIFLILSMGVYACAQTVEVAYEDLPARTSRNASDGVTLQVSGTPYKQTVGVLQQPLYDSIDAHRLVLDDHNDSISALRADIGSGGYWDLTGSVLSPLNDEKVVADVINADDSIVIAGYRFRSATGTLEIADVYGGGSSIVLEVDGTDMTYGGTFAVPAISISSGTVSYNSDSAKIQVQDPTNGTFCLNPVTGGGGSTDAADIDITDSEGYFDATNVEDALEEIMDMVTDTVELAEVEVVTYCIPDSSMLREDTWIFWAENNSTDTMEVQSVLVTTPHSGSWDFDFQMYTDDEVSYAGSPTAFWSSNQTANNASLDNGGQEFGSLNHPYVAPGDFYMCKITETTARPPYGAAFSIRFKRY